MLVSMHGGLISEMKTVKQSLELMHGRAFPTVVTYLFCLWGEELYIKIQENVPVMNSKIVSKTAFKTWGLP